MVHTNIQILVLFLYIYFFRKKKSKENHLSTLIFLNCLPVILFPMNTGDIDKSWLLIYFTILWAFYLFMLLKSKCHQIRKYQKL